jgi:guanylate kinase
LGVFILPPSEEELLRRLRSRKREAEAQIQKRFGQAREEIGSARASGVYDHFLINTDVDETIAQAVDLVSKTRATRR